MTRLAADLQPSVRGELEITDLNRIYMESGGLYAEVMGRGIAWLDTGTHDSLVEAALFIQTIEKRQGLKISCPEEVAFRSGFISADQLQRIASQIQNEHYRNYLLQVLADAELKFTVAAFSE